MGSVTIEKLTHDQDYNHFLDEMAKTNFENPDGTFYALREMLGNILYEELPSYIREFMKELISKSFKEEDGGIDPRLVREDNEIFWRKVEETMPSDEIIFETNEDYKKISTFWMPPDYKSRGTPADLIFSKTVPLTDIVCHFKEFAFEDDGSPISASFRVFLYNNWKEIADMVQTKKDTLAVIGGIIPKFSFASKKKKRRKEQCVAFPICIASEADFLLAFNMAYKNITRESVKILSIKDIHMWNTMILNTFYGIQLALLNPITEKVIAKQKEHPISTRSFTIGKKQKDRKVVYVKKYYIHEGDITRAINEYRTHNMRCPLYYVIGHKRHLRSGKVIWINGYWKGPERHKMQHLNEEDSLEMRQRIIDMRSVK